MSSREAQIRAVAAQIDAVSDDLRRAIEDLTNIVNHRASDGSGETEGQPA